MTVAEGEQSRLVSDPVDSQGDDGETEDEEVKRTCIAGHAGMRDSDLSSENEESTSGDENDEDEKDDDEVESQNNLEDNAALVEFVSGQIPRQEGTICRPTPMIPKLTTHTEESEESSNGTEESRSINARGAPLSFATDSNVDMDSSSEDEEEELGFMDGDGEDKAPAMQSFARGRRDELDCGTVDDQAYVQQGLNDETDNENYAIVGASGASVDDKWILDKQKRVLSSNTLSALNREAGHHADVPKRMRSSPTSDLKMPKLSLGLAAFDEIHPFATTYLSRGESPFHSSDEEGDKMLSEELEDKPRGYFDNSPIPLLTPPQSPRREYVVDDENTSAVEWPSNLVVDSAMMIAVMDLRPLSPASLQDLEEQEEEDRIKSADTSSLTPLLRSIYVGND